MSNADYSLNFSGIQDILDHMEDRGAAFLQSVAEDMVTDMKLAMGTSPPGRQYKRRSVVHTASIAGYPPNVDIGTLRASIRADKTGPLEVTIHDGVEYGEYLEFGTTKMQARPFFGPVFARMRNGGLENALRRYRLTK